MDYFSCDGNSKKEIEPVECRECDGKGFIYVYEYEGAQAEKELCIYCNGTGQKDVDEGIISDQNKDREADLTKEC